MKPRSLSWIPLLLMLVPAVAGAFTIRGTLRSGRRPAVRTVSTARPTTVPMDPTREAVIYLEQVPEKVEKKLAKNAPVPIVGQFGQRFVPRVTVVAAGTAVRFENQDRVFHNVFSLSPVRKFDIGKLAPRDSREVVFPKPGMVKLFNELEPSMAGFVFVTPNHAFVRPDSMGGWSFPKLPKGDYQVRVWHPTLGTISRRIETPQKGDAFVELIYR